MHPTKTNKPTIFSSNRVEHKNNSIYNYLTNCNICKWIRLFKHKPYENGSCTLTMNFAVSELSFAWALMAYLDKYGGRSIHYHASPVPAVPGQEVALKSPTVRKRLCR